MTEVMSFVDDHRVGELGYAGEAGGVALTSEISVAEHREVAEIVATTDVAEVLPEFRLPHRVLRGLRREQHHTLALMQDEPLDQHQPDEGLTETNTVAEERAPVLT